MKSQKGVTLTSLTMYVALIIIVIGILSVITASFRGNVKEIYAEGTSNAEIDKFNVYFLKEVKKQGNGITAISENEILFALGNKYTFNGENKCIYLNDNIKIAENIENCVFTSEEVNEKTVITVTIKAINTEEKSIEYVLSNEAYTLSYEDESKYTQILPKEYRQVEYIAATGTQYIDTGYVFKSKPKIVGEIMITSAIDRDIMGNTTASEGCFIIDFTSGGEAIYYRYSTSNYINKGRLNVKLNEWHNFEFADNVIIDNETVITISEYDFSTNNQTFLIGRGRNYGYAKFKQIKMYDGNELVRNFIPCYRIADNKVGMYDLVSDAFYTNIDTDNFLIPKDYVLPTENCELEYIQTSGTQYIDTGYVFKNKPKVVGEIMITSSEDRDIMGNAAANDGCFIIDFVNTRNLYYRYSSSSSTLVTTGVEKNKWHNFEFSDNVVIDEQTVLSIDEYDFSVNNQSFLIGKGRTYSCAKFKEIKMYDGDELVRDMVPYYSKDENKIGMYDKVNNVFYANSGTGEFIAGPQK